MKYQIIFVFCCVLTVKCEGPKDSRKAKIISFEPSKGDFEVGLDFSLPFLRIPIKSETDETTQYGHHDLNLPKININLSSLFVGGLVLLVTTLIPPLLNKQFPHHWDRSGRVSDDYNNPLKELGNQILEMNHGCAQKIACMSSQHTYDIDSSLTVKKILRNKLLSSIINTTALEEALHYGSRGNDCDRYGPCFLRQEDYLNVINGFSAGADYATHRGSHN